MLRTLYATAIVGPVVWREVVERGRLIGASGAGTIEHAVAEGWIVRVTLTRSEARHEQRLMDTMGLDSGEAEAIALAAGRRRLLIIDEKAGRNAAQMLEIDYVGTAGMLLEAFLQGHFTFDDLANALADLTSISWLSPKVVSLILKRAREHQHEK